MNKIRKAICCTCGEIRTCRRPRNHQSENYWLSGPVDPNWHRELGDLKCAHCGQITRHAILHPEGDTFRDHAERITRTALGGEDALSERDRDRIRQAYRQGRQANPYLRHMWRSGDGEEAREAGKTTVTTYCGESVTLPKTATTTYSGNEPLKAAEVRWDQDYEDPATGLWWREMDCVDCRRVANERRLARRRKELAQQLLKALTVIENAPAVHVETLAAALEAITDGGS